MIRWTARRKAEVCASVWAGELTAAEACRRHDLGAEELARWIELWRAGGQRALMVGQIKEWR